METSNANGDRLDRDAVTESESEPPPPPHPSDTAARTRSTVLAVLLETSLLTARQIL